MDVREQYRHVLRDWPKHRKTGLKTLAICGFAPNTRHLAPYNDDEVCILGLNEGYSHDYMLRSNGKPRYDVWMQIHEYEDCTRHGNESDPKHPEWLRSEHKFPIYMQEEFDDIPNAITFPLDEIVEKFVGDRLVRMMPDGTEEPITYFTSTAAMCVGLGLWYDFDRIELYGFNQATGTEYQGQKGSTEGWMHLAAGLGKQVVIPFRSLLLKGKIYGWEYAMHVGRQQLEARSKFLEHLTDEKKQICNNISGARIELERQAKAIKNQGTRKRLNKRVEALTQELIAADGDWNSAVHRKDEIDGLIAHIDNQFGYKVKVDETGAEVVDEQEKDELVIEVTGG